MGDVKNDVLVKLNVSTTQAFYSDTILNTWFNEAYMWAGSAHKWPFTEAVDTSLIYSNGTEKYNYPSGFKTNSIRSLTVTSGGVDYNLQKIDFTSYRQFRELQTGSDSSRIFSDWIRVLYINPNMDVTGPITLYGQKNVTALDGTNADVTNVTVFTTAEEEGNEAIAYKMMSFAMMREQDIQMSQAYEQMAMNILEGIWKRIIDEQFAYLEKNRGMFTRTNILRGAFQEEIFRRDQFF